MRTKRGCVLVTFRPQETRAPRAGVVYNQAGDRERADPGSDRIEATLADDQRSSVPVGPAPARMLRTRALRTSRLRRAPGSETFVCSRGARAVSTRLY